MTPTKSQSQRGLIFAKRNKYGSKENTPKKDKWIWDEGWENKGKLPNKVKNETVQNIVFKENFSRAKFINKENSLLEEEMTQHDLELIADASQMHYIDWMVVYAMAEEADTAEAKKELEFIASTMHSKEENSAGTL